MAITLQGATPLLSVFDVPSAVAFYRDVLGFEVLNTSTPFTRAKDDYGWAMLRRDNVRLMLNNAYEDNIRPATPDPSRIAAHADTVLYLDCPDVDEAFEHLRAHGIPAREPKVAYYGMKQVYLTDPDGYTLCFQCPAAAS